MDKRKLVTRTCVICGIEKPLSAFLQISGNHGTTYGNICSTCRGTGKTEKKETKAEEEGTTLPSGIRIGAKEKIHADQEKKRQVDKLKELYRGDLKKRDELSTDKVLETALREKAEKDHRKTYIEAKKKQGFLGKPTTPSGVTGQKPTQFDITPAEAQQPEVAKKAAEQQGVRSTTVDFSVPFINSSTGEVRFHSEAFLKLKQRLGSSAPMAQTAEQPAHKKTEAAAKTPSTDAKTPEKKSSEKDPVTEYIDRAWGPSSRRR